MDLEDIWKIFLEKLTECGGFESTAYKKYAGIPFLMVTCMDAEMPLQSAIQKIKQASAYAMKGKRLHSETVFVRKDQKTFIFRHRFYVPQEKMFCCGNLCEDCIRLL